MQVIGMVGKMAAGKDEFFKQLEISGYQVRRISFADAVRDEIEEIVADGNLCSPLWRKPYSDDLRAVVQWWGTDFRRKQDPDYWIKAVQHQVQEIAWADGERGENTLVVLTDCRFNNELEVVKKFGGLVVQVFVPEAVRAERLGVSVEEIQSRDGHASEQLADSVQADVVVRSDAVPYHYIGTGYATLKALLDSIERLDGYRNTVLPATQRRK